MARWSRLPALRSLRHRYIALRHGQSTANVAGTISSDPDIATVRPLCPVLAARDALPGCLGCCRAWGEGRAAASRGNRPLTAAFTLRTLSQPFTPAPC